MKNEADMLRRYAEEGSDAAFAEFVRHTIDFVYSAALRRLAGSGHAAADVAQLVFIAAARDARALARHPSVTGWLYSTTRNVALNLMRDQTLRRQREHEAHLDRDLQVPDAPSPDWERLRPVLDAAIDELHERDREAVLLRFFQARSFEEIGAQMQLSESGARMRVERALDKLHALLAKRGIRSTTAALGVALANEVTIAAPPGLAASVTGVALADAALTGSGAWSAAMSLMSTTKSLVTLGVLLALAGTAAFHQHTKADRACAELKRVRKSVAAYEARLSELTTQAEAAQRQRVKLENDLGQQLAAAAVGHQTAQSAREAERVAAEKAAADKYAFNVAALPILRFDPQLKELRLAKHRWEVNQDYGPLFKEFHFTPEQKERFVRLFADWTESRPDRGEPFLLVPYVNKTIGTEEFLAAMRNQFGTDVVDRYRELQRTVSPRLTVNNVSYRLYYLDEPFTPGQAEELAQVFAAASPAASWGTGPAFGTLRGLDTLDWNQVLAKAEPVLSSKQMEGMRAVAAQARLNGLLKSVGGK